MRAYKIADMEADFAKNLVDSNGNKYKVSEGVFPYVKALTLPNHKHFIKEVRAKKRVVLHETMGVLKGDLATLTKSQVSTAFVIARDGTAYQLFNPEHWAYHLGPSGNGSYSNATESASSIGIEISGLGPLKLKDGVLSDIYGVAYCRESDTHLYDVVPQYRGYTHFTRYTDAQYATLKQLVADLTAKYKIPATFLPDDQLYSHNVAGAVRAGVSTHTNWRKDKLDVAPNFDFKRIKP